MISCFAFNSGHSPAATSCQSTSLISGTVRPRRRGFRYQLHSRSRFTSCRYFDTFPLHSAHELHVTLGLANGVRRKPVQLFPGLDRRGHESVELLVIDMFIEWTSHSSGRPI